MRILHINLVYLPAYRYGGPIQSIHYLNKWLVKKGAEVTVYTTNIDGPDNLEVPLGVPVFKDGVRVFYFPASLGRFWFYSRDFQRALKDNINKFDIIHLTSVFVASSVLGPYYAKKNLRPYLISPRGSFMREPLVKRKPFLKKIYISLLEKRGLGGAAAIHFTTEAEKQEYIEANLPLRRGFVIPNGLDPADFRDAPPKNYFRRKFRIKPSQRLILFLSRINWKKGLDTLIPAFRRVLDKEPNSLLVLAGGDDEGYGKNLKSQISNLKISDKVIFTGMILGKDKLGALRDADVFVLPSYSENFGMAVIEAMYCGLPVIITPEVGIAAQIAKSKAGLVKKKDEGEFSEAIIQLLRDPKEAERMGKKGKKMVETDFLMPEIADKFLQEYNRIIQQSFYA